MSARITAADVQIVINDTDNQGRGKVMAMVQGRQRVFVVDYNPAWSEHWMCTCGHVFYGAGAINGDCAHIRATKEAIGE